MFRILGLALVVLLSLTAAALAVPTITVPAVLNLNPFQSGQTFSIGVSGGDQIGAMDFAIEIYTKNNGPIITAVTLTTGTIWDGNNNGQFFIGGDPLPSQAVGYTIITHSGFVAASGVLATITLDTLAPGAYLYRVTNVANVGSTQFADGSGDVFPNFVYTTTDPDNGLPASTLEVNLVPEPSATELALFGFVLAALWSLTRARIRTPVVRRAT